MSPYLFLASLGFLLAFLRCFKPIRTVLRPVFAALALLACNALGLPLGINLVTIVFITVLGIPGFCTLLLIYTLV